MTNVDQMELGMLVVAIGQALGYGEIDEAKRLQKTLQAWAHASENERRAIYHEYRNAGPATAGLDAS